jgi:hypothetical protein
MRLPLVVSRDRRRVRIEWDQVPTQVAYRLLVQRVAAGAEMPATLRSFAIGEAQPQMGDVSVSLELVIEPPGSATYAATADQVLPEAITRTLAEGQRLTVKVAPDDPQCVMLWNTPHALGGADPDTGRPLAATGPGARLTIGSRGSRSSGNCATPASLPKTSSQRRRAWRVLRAEMICRYGASRARSHT